MNALIADYAVKIFKGAKPADLPVQQSARIGAGGRGDRDPRSRSRQADAAHRRGS